MSAVREDLLKAADIIDERGWTQGTSEDRQGRVCATRAIRLAVGPNSVCAPRTIAAYRAVRAHIGNYRSIPMWNDVEGRTKDEVLAALRAAAEVAS